ncbi:hypothetical protein PVK06_027550 [Gossypium arboreum]|uniref:Uncharacterized protein n=1 Tax=Gossypium arboreum TaxID=29729 RepID=A0ABR0P3I3_GOSAR|nr:hypothetical protein PVK06_027550 [Gossypium arboreum]
MFPEIASLGKGKHLNLCALIVYGKLVLPDILDLFGLLLYLMETRLMYCEVDTEVGRRGLLEEERMFRHRRGQTRVSAIAVVVINGLCNNDNHLRPKRSITFIAPQQPLPA